MTVRGRETPIEIWTLDRGNALENTLANAPDEFPDGGGQAAENS